MAALHLAFPVNKFGLDADRVCGSSEMAYLVREFDWSRTLLGPICGWSEAMVAAVNLTLASPVPSTLYWGPELAMIYNDGYRLIAGARHPAALGRPGAEVWREAWHIVGPQFEATLRTGTTVQHDSLLVPIEQDGAMRDFYWNYSISPVYDGGRIAGIYNTCTDVTATVVTTRERDGLAGRLEQVMASTSDGSAMIDRNWCMTYMNKAALRATRKIPEMLGGNLWASLPELDYEGSPNVYHYKRAMYEGVAAEFESYYPEPLNHWLCIKVFPTPEGIAVFFQDITEAKLSREKEEAAAAALAASEEELRWTVALSAQMPWTADLNGGILWMERRGTPLERPPGRTKGDDWHKLVHADDVEQSAEVWEHARTNGTPYDREHRLLTTGGTYRWFRSRARPRRDEAGKIVKWYGTTEDIETRKQTEAALRTSEKLAVVGRLASSIAHEINNPLEAVTNLLFLARTSEGIPEEVQGFLDTAEREMQRASTITSQTLRFHRQSSKQTEVEFGGLIDEVLAVLHGKLVNSGVRAEVRRRTRQTICCFEGEIRQVLLNLAANAIDAMHCERGGRLLVRMREATDWRTGRRGQVVTVADTGPGMSGEVRARIFDAFFTTKGDAGTGLGLWVSQEIVARHKGALRLRTRQAEEDGSGGRGCVFTLFLPEEAVERPKRRKGDTIPVV